MKKNVKPTVLGVVTTLITPSTALAYDQITEIKDNSVLESSSMSRAVKSMDKAGVVSGLKANDTLNIRSASTTSSTIIGKITNGETVVITGQESNGWYEIDYKGKVGYVHNDYIRVTGDIEFKKTTEALNHRWTPTTSAGIISVIPNGTTVKVISTSNGWSKVYYKGEVGFCLDKYLSSLSINTNNNASIIESLNKEGQVIGVASNDVLNVRNKANTNSSIITTLRNGTKVQVIGKDTKTGWYKINYNGKIGFVSNKYIQINGDWNVSEKATGTRKTTDNLNFRTGPSTSYSIISTIPKGTVVDYYSESNGWAKIKYSGKDGYVSTAYLTTDTSSNNNLTTGVESMTATGKVVKTSDFLNVRSQPNTNSSILGKVYLSNTISITGRDKATGWYRINFNGSVGYVSDYYIELVNSTTSSTTKKITTTNVNLRSGAGTNYSIIKSITSNTIVEVHSTSGNWDKVTVGDKTGYIHNDYLKVYTGTNSGSSNLPSSKPLYSKVKVVVDAGHGGKDSGAVGHGRKEKDIVLSISQKVNSKLKSLGFQTIMTRSNDTYISLSERYSIANRNNADIFVSIHANSSTSTSASGIETLYKNYKTLADNIQAGMLNETNGKSRGLKYRTDLAVLNGTRMPSALVEVGFISNSSESSQIGSDSYQEKLATGIVKGIAKYTDNNINK